MIGACDHLFCFLRLLLLQRIFKSSGCLQYCALHCRHVGQGVQQSIIVNQAFVAGKGYGYAGFVQLAGVGFAFVAQYVAFGSLYEGRG